MGLLVVLCCFFSVSGSRFVSRVGSWRCYCTHPYPYIPFIGSCLLLLLLIPQSAFSQTHLSNLRTRTINARLPIQVLDTLTIAPTLISATDTSTNRPVGILYFTLQNNRLSIDTARLRKAYPGCFGVRVVYRVLPFDLSATLRRLDTAAIRRNAGNNAIEFDYAPYKPTTDRPWETAGGLSSNGAYTRGLSLGNSQNLVFNSNLNLQLNGKLGNDLELQAALSDNSIPLQPDGTTRQLNEFDRIFIQIKKKNTALTAGDYDLIRPHGYFPNYFKRLQGAMIESKQIWPRGGKKNSSDTLFVRGAAAISRGKFSRQTIQGQEGNQGPYRLQGSEGERFIIVLAGTEKVFIDGQLLRRGLEDDYIIDYNLGELAFTARRLISKDSRIIVEFEYAVQNFLRSTLAANALWSAPRIRTYLNVYSEQDSRNSGASQDLSPQERRALALAGDNLRTAFASGIDTLADFDASRVLYQRVDTVVCGIVIPVLVYSTNPSLARYGARFTETASGQGNYVSSLTAANGRVFRWVAPDPVTCQPKGNFEPVVRLLAPELRQLYTVGAEIQPFKGGQIKAEAAVSNRDLNRFSPLGNGDNYGAAGMLGVRQQFGFGKKNQAITANDAPAFQTVWQGQADVVYEQTAKNFLPLNPYRPAEFVRDWNTDNNRDTVAEQIMRGGISLRRTGWGSGRYEYGAFRRQGVYDGARHLGRFQLQHAGFEVLAEANLLLTEGSVETTRFSRPKVDISKTFFHKQTQTLAKPRLKVGFYGERERNARTLAGVDTLAHTSFWYDMGRIYLQSPDLTRPWQFGGFLGQRNDYFPTGKIFKGNTIAREVNLNGAWNNTLHPVTMEKSTSPNAPPRVPKPPKITQTLTWNFTYRTLRILDPELTTQQPQQTYLGRADYNFAAWKNALTFNTGYELGSGQSPKIAFNYLLVNPGQGQYTWIDRNRDSILQVDEMEIAVFQDQALYVRVGITTTDYIRTNNMVLNQNLRLEPRLLWAGQRKGWRRIVSRFSTQSTFQINRRTFVGAEGVSPWNPFQLNIADTNLVTLQASARNVLFINRANPKWDASLAYGSQSSQVTLNTGFEQRRNTDFTLHTRVNFGRHWALEADAEQGQKNSDHQTFSTRDFAIRSVEAGPKITWMANRAFRAILKLNFQNSLNTLPSAEKATQTDWNAELTWNPASKENAQGFRAATSLRAKMTFSDVHYTGQPNTAVAFNMLEGLQDGRNFLWSVLLDRQLSKSMQISLNYEGRKTGDNRVVHVGRAQVRALF